ncbi:MULTISPECIES: hypothetical protein [unclassified Sphingobacterium]|uniref:hypothetical protein n=1 Tax=unclassified Sphingobacterium TaxID=2609468 RepID=UPI0010537E90|nr:MULTISPECIES: hypothetical protein [unclassified Sphingobacterium]MCS3556573.1 hypothetical protein [Sphingobacterium sp. JUb21]
MSTLKHLVTPSPVTLSLAKKIKLKGQLYLSAVSYTRCRSSLNLFLVLSVPVIQKDDTIME